MKRLDLLLTVFFSFILTLTYAQTSEERSSVAQDTENIEVYYFHYTRRCATCQAVEDESKKALEEYYSEQLDSGEVVFLAINLDEDSNEKLAESLEVAGQSLFVIKGDEKVDLTVDGFKYARTNPEKLHESLKEIIDGMM